MTTADEARFVFYGQGTLNGREGIYGGDCAACKYPVVEGRTLCRTCERLVETSEGSA